MEIVNYILVVLDIVVLFTLINCVLRGFIKGTPKMLLTSCIKWGLVLFFIVFSSQITTHLLNSSFPTIGVLKEYIMTLINENIEMDLLDSININTYQFVYSCVFTIVRFILIYAAIIIISIIIYPIINIFLHIFGIHRLIKKFGKNTPSRFLGMGLGIVIFVFVFTVIYMPIYGTMALYETVSNDYQSFIKNPSTEENINEISFTTYKELEGLEKGSFLTFSDSFNSSIVYKILHKKDNEMDLPEKYLDKNLEIKTQNGNINLLKEYYNFRKIFPVIEKINNEEVTKEERILTVEDFATFINVVKNTEILPVAIPITLEVSMDTLNQHEIEISNEYVNDTNWKSEANQLNLILDILLELYESIYVYKGNIEAFLGDNLFPVLVPRLFEECLKLTVIKEYGLDLADKKFDEYINDLNKEEDNKIASILEIVEINNNIVGDIKNSCLILQNIYKLGFLEKDGIDIDFENQENQNLIENLVLRTFDLSFIKGKENNITDLVFELIGGEKYFDKSDLEIDKIDWEKEPKALVVIFQEYCKLLDGKKINEDILETIIREDNDNLIDAFANSDIFTKVIVPVLNKAVQEQLIEKKLTMLSKIIEFSSTSDTTLKNDLKLSTKIISSLKKLGFLDGEVNLSNELEVKNVLDSLIELSFIKGREGKLIEGLLEYDNIGASLAEKGIVLDVTNVNWEKENIILSRVIAELSSYDNFDFSLILANINNENQEDIKKLLKNIIQLQMIQKSFPTIIEKFLDDNGLAKWKSDWLIDQKTNFDLEKWDKEIDIILEIVLDYQNNSCDFENIKNDDLPAIKELLEKMVQSKVLTLNPVVSIINDFIQEKTMTNKEYLVVNDNTDWNAEINIIFGDSGLYYQINKINKETPYIEYGKMLDTIKSSTLFEYNFYELVKDYIMTLSIYQTLENPNGILTQDDLMIDNLEQVTSWEKELGLIDKINLESGIQTGEVLDEIMKSVLLRRQISVYIMNIIKDKELEEYYLESNINNDIDIINNKIETSNNTWSWSKEISTLEEFKVQLTITLDAINNTESSASSEIVKLYNLSLKGTITTKIMESLCQKYPEIDDVIKHLK